MLEQTSFVIVSLSLLVCASRVVTARNLVHTVLWLGLTLALTAVVFVMLRAPFLAAIQIILYTGGVLTLMLFGVMLTQRDAGFVTVQNPSHRRLAGGLLAAAVFAMFAAAIVRTERLPATPGESSIASLSVAFFGSKDAVGDQLLAFEVLSLLLLAAVLGAIVVARKRDAGLESEERPPIPARRALPRPQSASTGSARADPGQPERSRGPLLDPPAKVSGG